MRKLNLIDYFVGQVLNSADLPFYAIISAAMRKADYRNLEALKAAFPDVWADLQERYNAPGGVITEDVFDDPESAREQALNIAKRYVRGISV